MAGYVGVDPTNLTWWELATMAEGKSREEWNHTSSQIWIAAELNRDRKKRAQPFAPDDFDPYCEKKGAAGNGQPFTVGVLLAMKGRFQRDRN